MTTSPSMPLRCKCRRQAVTNLRCSRCSVPICPDCSKMYPVGVLCRDCAGGRHQPARLYDLSGGVFVKTFFICLAVGVLMGWLIGSMSGFGIMAAIWGGLFQGLAVSEAGMRASGRKLGWKIETIVGSCIVLGLITGWILTGVRYEIPLGELLTMHLLNPWTWVTLVFATVVGVGRFRSI